MLRNVNVEKTISYVAHSLATIMEAEVMILDNKNNVISGTASSEKGYRLSGIYNHVISHKELVVVEDPGFNRLCAGCAAYGTCNELIELAAPVLVEDQCIGIISVTCYEEKQHKRIVERLDAYKEFLLQMSSLLSSRAQEVETKEALRLKNAELTAIINTVDEGIVALDLRGHVAFCNQLAEQMFATLHREIVDEPITQFCPRFHEDEPNLLLGKQEVEVLSQSGERQMVYMSAHRIIADGQVTGTILTMEGSGKVNRFVGGFIGNHQMLSSTDIVSVSDAIEKVKRRAAKVSATDSTVLIRGESGTGKEMFARAIHEMSPRSKGPFIALNCAAIPDTLLESELFGYESGAFTGAQKGGKPGYFELADTGTIFLDEIGDMAIYLQGKLLRVLQEKMVQRVGSAREKKIDIRIIAATNKELEKMVEDNRFRGDLFYRLNVIPLVIPPLRERGDADILGLVAYFMKKYGQLYQKTTDGLSRDVERALLAYKWPGNVRELENAVEYMLNMESSPLVTFDSLPEYIRESCREGAAGSQDSLRMLMAEEERKIIAEALNRHGKTQKGKESAANALGIGIASLYRKIRAHGIE
ncbi:MAG: sigma 54-interacting transcriptional regulator [Planctomycetaceae bacterium]|nr:sigma 54-interacting transcriptional regulator [Planctomycetaceae bacterium]